MEYEGLLNEIFRNVRALGMCQYHKRKLPPQMIDGALQSHPIVTLDRVANPYYQPSVALLNAMAHGADAKVHRLRDLLLTDASVRIDG